MQEVLPSCHKTPITVYRNKLTVKCPQIVCYLSKINLWFVTMLTATLNLSCLWLLKHSGEDSNTRSDWFYCNLSEQQYTVPATGHNERSKRPAFILLQLWNTLFDALLRSRLSTNNRNSFSFFPVDFTCQGTELVKWQTYIVQNSSGALRSFLLKSLSLSLWFWLFPSPPISLLSPCSAFDLLLVGYCTSPIWLHNSAFSVERHEGNVCSLFFPTMCAWWTRRGQTTLGGFCIPCA